MINLISCYIIGREEKGEELMITIKCGFTGERGEIARIGHGMK
jgi:hypothetical protein